jgi:two-component system, LytTR family, sensor kinase
MRGLLPQRRWVTFLALLGVWTLVGLFFASRDYLHVGPAADRWESWGRSMKSIMPDWYLWGMLAPLIVRLSRRYRLDRRTLAIRAPIHVISAAGFALLHLALAVSVTLALEPAARHETTWSEQFQFHAMFSFHWNVVIYAMIVAVSHAVAYYEEYQERDRRTWQLESSLAQARLQALQLQLHPHFLFNTLSTVAELIHEQPDVAEDMIVRLGELLRESLDHSQAQEATLESELAFVERYLAIEQVRFADRLSIEVDVDAASRAAIVPRLVLQPLVENAVRHGISRIAGPGRITLSARRSNGQLRLTVADNGPGPRPGAFETGRGKSDTEKSKDESSEESNRDKAVASTRSQVGLANTRARLEQLYPGEHHFRFDHSAATGSVVTLEFPYRTEPACPSKF